MKKILFYLGIGLISLTPLLWFKGDLIIAHGDDSIFLNPGVFFGSIKWSWDTFFYNCGGANNSMPLLFPLSLFWNVLFKLGVGLAVIEKIWLVAVWFITGLSMFYLTRALGLSLTASFFAVLLYLLNIFVIQQPLIYNFRLPYMALPLLLAFTIKGLNSETNMIKYIILFSLSTFLLVSAWTNPPWVLPALILTSFYVLCRLILSRTVKQGKQVVYFVIGISIFTFLLNLWWFIPNIASFGGSLVTIGGLNLNIFKGEGFYEVFRFLKSWAFGRSGYRYHELYYSSWIIILAGYIIPIIVFSSLFRKKKGFKDYYFFVFAALSAVFLAKGPLPPLGEYYNYLFRNLPGFIMFREPYTKFMPIVIFAFAVLLGDSISWICSILKNKYSRNISVYFSIAILFIIGAASFPIFTNSIIWQRQNGWKENPGGRSAYVKVPSYWRAANVWFKLHFKKGRLFVVPRSTGVYNWDSGFNCAGTAASYLLGVPVVSCSGNTNTAVRLLNYIYNAFVEEDIKLSNILRVFSVSYILHDKDIYTNPDWRFYDLDYLPPGAMEERLRKQRGIETEEGIGHLDWYKIRDEYYLPKIFAADNLTYVKGTLSDLVLEPLKECFQGNPAVFLEGYSPKEILPENLAAMINNVIVIGKGFMPGFVPKYRNIIYLFKRKDYGDLFPIKLLEPGDYNISLKLKPNFTSQFITSGSKIDIDLDKLIVKGKFYPNKVSFFDYEVSPYEIILTTLFDGTSQDDEYLQIKDFDPEGKDIDIDINRYPYLSLCYRVEDSKVQTLQLVLGIDINNDNEPDFWLRDILERAAPTKFSYLYYDVYSRARQINKHAEYYKVVKIEIYPHKLWGVDCSQKPQNYNFYIKKLQFLNKLNEKKELLIKDKIWDKFLSEKDMIVESSSNELIVHIDPIDLIKYNIVEFQWQGIQRNSLVDVKLVLDSNNDGLVDREETIYSFNTSAKAVSHLIDFKNVISRGYENVSNLSLLGVKWSGRNIKPDDIRKSLKRLIVYKQQPIGDYRNFHFKDYAFSLDGRRYFSECFSLGNGKSGSVVVDYKDIPLTSNSKTIENLLAENDAFSFQWICFKKSMPPEIPQMNLPDIEWEKVNPTKYLVRIKDAKDPFLLVFSESFHKGWRAYIWPTKEEIKNHLPANGYAQAWWVENPMSNFQILIKYMPQDWTNLGWGISGLTLLGCLVYLWRRK